MFDLKSAIIPLPVLIDDRKKSVKIGSMSKSGVELSVSGTLDGAAQLIKNRFSDFVISTVGGYKINIKIDKNDLRFDGKAKKEGYFIDINEGGADITGADEAGAYYGAVSFSKLIYAENGEVYLPMCFILDYPYFEKRGHFMECRYGSDFMTLDDWKKGIDYLSEMKINTLTVGIYGCWKRQYDGVFAEYLYTPIEKYPVLNTPRDIKYYSAKERRYIYKKEVLPTMFEEDYFGDMIAYGKEKHMEIFPLFNSLGHNTLIPRLFPEISAVDEEGNFSGVGFCTSNEKTYEIMFDIYDEIIDKYLKPNGIDSFEIGLDEIWDVLGADESDLNKFVSSFCKCEKCKEREFGDLLTEYIIKIAKHMKEKGIKNLYIYHDMLLEKGLLNENFVKKLKDADVYDIVVIDWWDYWTNREMLFGKNIDENVNSLFRGIGKCFTGYYHWALPMQCNENIYHITDMAKERGFEGVIAYSSFEYCYDYNYNVLAEALWNPDAERDTLKRYASVKFPENSAAAYEALEIANDLMFGENEEGNNMSLCYTTLSYYPYCYLNRNKEYPQSYPERAFIKIRDDEERHLKYIRAQYAKAVAAYKFFDENKASETGNIWKNNAAVYMVLCDQFITLYTLDEKYKNGTCDEYEFLNELCRLIKDSEELISLTESVRIAANSYTYIRNMSVMRQAMCDMRDYIKKEMSSGKKPEIDIFNFGKYLSDVSWFLR